jgi:hypothetical protein
MVVSKPSLAVTRMNPSVPSGIRRVGQPIVAPAFFTPLRNQFSPPLGEYSN